LIDNKETLLLKTKEMEKELVTLKKELTYIDLSIQAQTANLREAPDSVKEALYKDLMNLCIEKEERQSRIEKLIDERKKQEKNFQDIEIAKQTILNFSSLIKQIGYEQKLELIRNIVKCVIVKDDDVHIFLKGSDTSDFFLKEQEG
jgi:hypothetical protein